MTDTVKGTEQRLIQGLGASVVEIWSYLPPDIQQELFEEAIDVLGEPMRHRLALFLHDHHDRTDLRPRATLVPDAPSG